jgi:hypothetical protein
MWVCWPYTSQSSHKPFQDFSIFHDFSNISNIVCRANWWSWAEAEASWSQLPRRTGVTASRPRSRPLRMPLSLWQLVSSSRSQREPSLPSLPSLQLSSPIFVMQSGQSLIVRCRTCPTCRSLLSYGSVQLKFRSSSWRRLIWQCKRQCRQCSISQHDRKKKRVVSICWNMCWNRGFCQHVSTFQLRKRWRRPTSAKRRRTWSMRSAEIRRDSERHFWYNLKNNKPQLNHS